MASKYRILSGHTFRRDNGTLAAAGDEIELDDDVAQTHAHRIEPASPLAPVQTPAPDADEIGKD